MTAELVQRPTEFGLGHIPARLKPEATTTMVCGFCSTGCGLNIHLRDGQAINLSASQNYPVNLGMACPKGWEALTPLSAPDRATVPLLRNPKTGKLEEVDWDQALQIFMLRFKAILDQHGPESVAWIGTGQITTEELAFLGTLAKVGMGIRHGDSNTRQCMATSAVAYKESFGFDAPPYTYADFEESDVLVFIGSNLCVAHPIMWQRVLRNPHRPEIIVIDPRKTETAMAATQHVALRPKSDLVLLYGVAAEVIKRGAIKRDFLNAHTNGFEDFARFVAAFTPEIVRATTGLSAEVFEKLVSTIATGERVSFWWTMGVNQGHESTRTAQAIINLALMTGNIGRPGTGANSITGQCNAMGSRLYSNTSLLVAGRDFTNAEHRRSAAEALRLPEGSIPTTNSLSYDQILQSIDEGKIKGLWIIGTNPAHSWIGKTGLAELFGKLDFLVVQDMYATTETARLADLLLPAAGWGEKEGTFINSERRIGLIKKVSRAPGEALADFQIFRLIAHYWGCEALFREWTAPQAAFQILKRCSAGQPCDITGIEDFRMIEACGGIQWPFPAQMRGAAQESSSRRGDRAVPPHPGPLPWGEGERPFPSLNYRSERRLFEDGCFFHGDGKARFIFEQPRDCPELPDAAYPFILLTGRSSSAQWHTETRTKKSDLLRRLSPERLLLEIHPQDARRLRIPHHGKVRVSSRRGEVTAHALLTATVSLGQVFLPMHDFGTNLLTFPAFDRYSRQPSYKFCAVKIEALRK